MVFVLAVPICAWAAAGCGKSSTGPGATNPDSLSSVAGLTGYLFFNPIDRFGFNGNIEAQVGDVDAMFPGETLRGLVTFDLNELPKGSTVTQATIQMDQCLVEGNPYGSLGAIVLDHLLPKLVQDSASYDTTALASNVATIAGDSTVGLKTADVTSSVEYDRTIGDTLSQFRMHYSIEDGNNNGVTDLAVFRADSGFNYLCPYVSGHQPLLIVSYH
jgi:hypothetical protein